MSYDIDLEFIELAREIIDEVIPTPNAVWKQIDNDSVLDPNKPWITVRGDSREYPIRILMVTDNSQGREFLRHLEETAVPVGNTNAIMYEHEFTPKQKDVVLWKGREIVVVDVKEICPVESVVLYLLRLGL
jgi:hypothetical protein